MRGWGKWKREKMVFPLLIFPQILSFYIFSPAAIFPLNGWWNVMLIYNYQQKCAICILTKKITLPLFLFLLFLSPFSCPFFLLFPHCLIFHFSPAPFLSPPPSHSILQNIYPCISAISFCYDTNEESHQYFNSTLSDF